HQSANKQQLDPAFFVFSIMDHSRKKKDFIYQPIYRGGQEAMKTFISQNLKYPEAAQKAGVEGTVRINYDINHLGKVIKTKVISSLGHGCDEEAQRLVKLLRFEIPKKPRNLKVRFHKDINIHFKLPKGPSIQYEVKPSKPAQNETEEKTTKTFSFSIQFNRPNQSDK
ncbi:MAG: energy transducer TonB, partial [Bacteroidota bacterium]